MNTNSLKYMLPLKKKFPPFMKREAIYALQTTIELLKMEKTDSVTANFENNYIVDANKVRELLTGKRTDELKLSNVDLTAKIKELIIELNGLNPGKYMQGGNKTRRYRGRKGNNKTKKRGGGWLGDKLSSVKNSVVSAASVVKKSAVSAASSVSGSIKSIPKQKKFFTAIQDIFDECYKSMVDKYLEEASALSKRTDIVPLPKNKTMTEHVAKFFLILHDCTFNKLLNMFMNTILFNAINMYNPMATVGPTLMSVPGMGPVSAGALLLIPTVHILCSMRLMASEFKNASILLNENDMEMLRKASNPEFISIDNAGNFVDKVKVSDIASKLEFYKSRVFYIETKALSHYAKIVGVDMSDPAKCKLTVRYTYDESKDKVLEKTKLENSETDMFITGDTLLQPVYPFKTDENSQEFNSFFVGGEGKSSLSPEFQNGVKGKMDSLIGQTISLNGKFLGTVQSVVFNKKMLSLSNLRGNDAVYKNVQIKFSIGNKAAGPDKYKETTITIKYNEIGLMGEVGKKYFQIIKIMDYPSQ